MKMVCLGSLLPDESINEEEGEVRVECQSVGEVLAPMNDFPWMLTVEILRDYGARGAAKTEQMEAQGCCTRTPQQIHGHQRIK